MSKEIQDETRWDFYGTILGTWGMVMLFAVVHDQYVVGLSPRHFTDYHTNPLGIENVRVLAAFWGVLSSVSPGMTLGVVLYLFGRWGARKKMATRRLLMGVLYLICFTEICALISLGLTHITHRELYPSFLYVDNSFEMMCSQTVQLTAYFMGMLGSVVLLSGVYRRRKQEG
ncbi:hypothetical protein P3T73_03870 [Kiritimatiellota bacterium B12222]|nr:hypothetical protein P3T73_03870 [Kiritimatiellota bacterium B12222]